MNISCKSNNPQVIQNFNQLMARLHSEQNLLVAAAAGSVAALLSGALWAVVTVVSGYQIGWMAMGVGFAVGFAVRLGKGIDKVFGVLSAILSLAGCLIGNILAIFGLISQQENIPLLKVVSVMDYSMLPELIMSSFTPLEFLFYGIAVWEGYRFAFRKLNSEEQLILSESQGP